MFDNVCIARSCSCPSAVKGEIVGLFAKMCAKSAAAVIAASACERIGFELLCEKNSIVFAILVALVFVICTV